MMFIKWLLSLIIIDLSLSLLLGPRLSLVGLIGSLRFLRLLIILYHGPDEVVEDWGGDLFRLGGVVGPDCLGPLLLLVLFCELWVILCCLRFLRPDYLYSINDWGGISLRLSFRCSSPPLRILRLFGRSSLLWWSFILWQIIIYCGFLFFFSLISDCFWLLVIYQWLHLLDFAWKNVYFSFWNLIYLQTCSRLRFLDILWRLFIKN